MNTASQCMHFFSNLGHAICRQVLVIASLWLFASGFATAGEPQPIAISDTSFKCLSDMTRVRHFFVDNLQGGLEATIAVAEKGQGSYPPGSVVQLVPAEAMVKRAKGFNAATNDWEFFELDVSEAGTSIRKRGFADVVNKFGGNCFACHVKARPEFDMICETGHGCDPIPITRPMVAAIQKTDPRCSNPEPLNDDDKKALMDLEETLKEMASSRAATAE